MSCKSKQRQDFINLMASYSYNKLIGFPTRVIKASSTLIDNIYSNMPNVYDTGTSGVLNNMRCSDHLPILRLDQHLSLLLMIHTEEKGITV